MLGTSLFTRSRALQGISSELKSELFAGPSTHLQIRTATKRGGGSSKNGRDSAGKRLGVKKYTDQYILPGQIIIRQRGSSFHPGQHVRMGTDKTLYATEPGYVKYYTHDQPFPHRPSFTPTSSSTLSSATPTSTSTSSSSEVGSFEINESNSEEYVPSEYSQPPVKRPRGLRQYVGIVRSREDRLPRDESREGRDRRFWGWPKEVASVTEV